MEDLKSKLADLNTRLSTLLERLLHCGQRETRAAVGAGDPATRLLERQRRRAEKDARTDRAERRGDHLA